jgi:hypothetical protein
LRIKLPHLGIGKEWAQAAALACKVSSRTDRSPIETSSPPSDPHFTSDQRILQNADLLVMMPTAAENGSFAVSLPVKGALWIH